MSTKKLILVIGATGAQGLVVVDWLLAPAADGSPSPYAVRALTRDPSGRRAQELAAKGVELFKGRFDDFPTVMLALQGVYGVWNNTDGFSVGEDRELWAGVRIFEIAKQLGTVRHYVWSSLDYTFKAGKFDPKYMVDHFDGKGRVADWMRPQESIVGDNDMSWSIVTSSPYMEMLNFTMFGPIGQRPDGTYVFASPIQDGHVTMTAMDDIGFFARYTFDHREETSGVDLRIASDLVGWDDLVATFTRVTGLPAVHVRQSLDEAGWIGNYVETNVMPIANEKARGDGSRVWGETFKGFWAQWRDDIITRDWEWIRRVNPNGYTLERWMREKNYRGVSPYPPGQTLLKNVEEGKGQPKNVERLRELLQLPAA